MLTQRFNAMKIKTGLLFVIPFLITLGCSAQVVPADSGSVNKNNSRGSASVSGQLNSGSTDQVDAADTGAVIINSGTGINISVSAADSSSSIHLPHPGIYFTSDALNRNYSGGSVAAFDIPAVVFHDRSKDSLVTVRLILRNRDSQGGIQPESVWAFSDGRTIYVNARNPYLHGIFYPLIQRNRHFYYRAYNGPDPNNSSILGGIAVGLGGAFTIGNIGIGVSSALPLMNHSLTGKRKLPAHHLVWMEYDFKTGNSREISRSPFL